MTTGSTDFACPTATDGHRPTYYRGSCVVCDSLAAIIAAQDAERYRAERRAVREMYDDRRERLGKAESELEGAIERAERAEQREQMLLDRIREVEAASPFETSTAATAYGCFRHHHSSHPESADAWQCIREHFAEMRLMLANAYQLMRTMHDDDEAQEWVARVQQKGLLKYD